MTKETEGQNMSGGVAIDVLDSAFVNSIRQKLSITTSSLPSNEQPTIYRVPTRIRQYESEDYEPRLVSIGPYHHNKPSLQPMEEHKWRYLQAILSRNQEVSLEHYLAKIKALEAQARSSYSESIKFNSNEFLEMMLLDGCFIVELFAKDWGDWDDPIYGNGRLLKTVCADMLLLENQLPYCILQCIFSCVFPNEDADVKLVEDAIGFCDSLLWLPLCESFHHLLRGRRREVESFHHFLESFRHLLHGRRREVESFHRLLEYFHHLLRGRRREAEPFHRLLRGRRPEAEPFHHLLHLIYCLCLPTRKREINLQDPTINLRHRTIPSAEKLKESGIKFKRNEHKHNVLDIEFKNGVMEIPYLFIDAFVICLFRNFLALEQCYRNAGSDFAVYTVFMDTIINTKADVEILRDKRILEHAFGSDEEVALLFNGLTKGNQIGTRYHLSSLFNNVNEYCDSKWHRWGASFKHDYFRSPWAIVALIGAIVVVILTAIQSFFSVYAYVRPPPH